MSRTLCEHIIALTVINWKTNVNGWDFHISHNAAVKIKNLIIVRKDRNHLVISTDVGCQCFVVFFCYRKIII